MSDNMEIFTIIIGIVIFFSTWAHVNIVSYKTEKMLAGNREEMEKIREKFLDDIIVSLYEAKKEEENFYLSHKSELEKINEEIDIKIASMIPKKNLH